MKRKLKLLAILALGLLLASCAVYQHDVVVEPSFTGLEAAIASAYMNESASFRVDSDGGFTFPITGIPELDVLKTLLGTEGFVTAAETLGLSITDSTATTAVIKSGKWIPYRVEEHKSWFGIKRERKE